MTALSHVVHTPVHLERHQTSVRNQLGLLEKKKDYKLRAKDQKKQKSYRANLETKAFYRNTQEFYHKMHSVKLRDSDGKIVNKKSAVECSSLSRDQRGLLNQSDRLYVNLQRQIDRIQKEKLQNLGLPFLETGARRVLFPEPSDELNNINLQTAEVIQGSKKLQAKVEARENRASKLTEVLNALDTKRENMQSPKISVRKRKNESSGKTEYIWEQVRKR
jgi:Utp11 protein